MAQTKNFNIQIDSSMDVSKITKALSEVQQKLSGLKLPQTLNSDIRNTIKGLNEELSEFQQQAGKGITSMQDVKKITSSFEKISNSYKKLNEYIGKIDNKELKELIPDSALRNIDKATNALKEYSTDTEAVSKKISNLNKEIDKQQKILQNASNKKGQLSSENVTLGQLKGNYQQQIKKTEKELSNLYEQQKKVVKGSVEYSQIGNQIKSLNSNLKTLNKEYNNASSAINKNKTAITGYNTEINQAKTAISSLSSEIQQMKSFGMEEPFEKLRQKIAEIKNVNISEIPNDFNKLKTVIDSLTSEELDKIKTQVEQIKTNSDSAAPSIKKMGDSIDSIGSQAGEMDRINREISNLTSQVEYFFGIQNTIQLFKRGIRQAYESVKELDAAMTETAVVTDFSVGDMWEALPKYTAAANELGTTTLGAYETMTLYYQQGLKTNEVFEIGTETMKMARIANMDYTKATDLMTAALRGFNMELNETSAKRINDVYSELAAITAADTEEIADAMTRTASIASSAGMEFETTSAFLSQMIETTREAPENLGTAMKTIIARFQELKKAPSEIASEIDGEAVNVNKIDAALKSIGVSLMDNVTGQFRELDDVFLEISEKWNGLDKNTQRYIATVAAGSRQQSRFIAMMNNYDRTMELVDAANNSAGASQRQFEKTTESLESKLNKLKNAWNEFTRNLANSTVIKGTIDLLTRLINIVNKILNTMPGGISVIAAFGIAIKGLGVSRKVLQALIATLTELISVSGTSASASFIANLGKQFKSTGDSVSILEAIFNRLKVTLGKKGVAAAATDSTAALQALQVGGTGAGAGMTAAGEGAAVAGAGFTAALGPILAIVAAIGAVVAIGHVLWSTTQETERELKRVSEAANDASEHTNTLKDSISKLSEQQQAMAEIDSSFNTLVKGTDEWNSKLIESNTLISDIISQFPEMAKYLQTIDGRMKFSEDGWDEVNKLLEERLQTSANLQASLSAKEGRLSAKTAIENIDIAAGPDGISEENLIKVAKIFAKNPATTDYNTEQFAKVLERENIGNVSKNTIDNLLASADELASAFHNYTAASESEETVIKSLLQSNLETKGISGSEAAAAADIASKSYNPESTERWWGNNKGADEEQSRQWAEQMGYRLDSWSGWGQGVKYTDLATGEKGEISNEEVLVQFNELQAQEEATKIAETISDNLVIDNKKFEESFSDLAEDTDISEAFSQILTGDASVNEKLINSLIDTNNIIDSDKISEAVDNMLADLSTDEQAKRIANYLGKDIEEVKKDIPGYTKELVNTLEKNTKEISKVQRQQNNKLRGMLGKASGLTAQDIKADEDSQLPIIENYINSLTQKQKSFLTEIGDKITTNLGEESLAPFLDAMQEIYTTGNEAEIQKATDFINNIDFSNPIQAAQQLKLGINSNIDALSEMSEGLLETGKSSLDASAQFQYLYTSEPFSDITEEIDKMVLEEGKIDGAGVIELTSKSSELKDMIDNTGISVEILGQTFTALSEGEITLSNLTSGVMDALSSFDKLDGVIRETADFIGNLDLGVDTGQFSEDLHSTADEILEMYEGGEYGNPQIENFIKQFFGEERWNKALADAKGNLQVAASQFIEEIKLIDDNLYSVWASFDEKDKARLDAYNKEAGTNIQVQQLENGAMKLDIGEASTEKVIQGIMRAYQVTEEYANLILTDFMNNSADLRSELANNDWTAGIDKYVEDKTFSVNGEDKTIFNQNEIETLSKIQGKDEVEYWRQIATQIEATGTKLDDINTKTASLEQITSALKAKGMIIDIPDPSDVNAVKNALAGIFDIENLSKSGMELWNKFEQDGIYSIDALQEMLSNLGIPQETINEISQQMAKAVAEENPEAEVEIKGVKMNVEEVAKDVNEAAEKAAEEADYTAMGEAMAKALSEIKVDYSGSADDYVSGMKTAGDTAAKNAGASMKTSLKGAIENAQTKWGKTTFKDKKVDINVTPKLTKSTIKLSATSNKEVVLSTYKTGTKNRGITKNETALVGEVGPELVENNDGTATLYGANGPTLANLSKGAVVHNAEDTKKILRGNTNFETINRYYDGSSTAYGKKKQQKGPLGTGAGATQKESTKSTNENTKSTSKNTKSTDKNTKKLNEASEKIDKLHNNLRYIDKELRMVNKYQARYERLLETVNVTGKDLVKNLNKQKKYYKLIIKRSNITTNTRQKQIKNILGRRAKYTYEYNTKNKEGNTETKEKTVYTKADISKWFKYNSEFNMITWNIDKLNKLQSSKRGADRALYNHLVNDIGPKLEGFQSDIEEANDNLKDAKNALEDMLELGKEAYLGLEQRVYEALISREQEKIDKLSQINGSINDANGDLIDTIQSNLSKIRQDRENQKTEDDITTKERRLAYLRRDTSNANALEIKQLEKELADQKQDYTDTLIDQKISELQTQNDEAAMQRQQQIDLLQAQLEHDKENGYFWNEAYRLIREGIDKTGKLVHNSELVKLLKSGEGFEGLSVIGQQDWYQELNSLIAQSWEYLKNINIKLEGMANTLYHAVQMGEYSAGNKVKFTKDTNAMGESGTFTGTIMDDNKTLYYEGSKKDNVHFEIPLEYLTRQEDGSWKFTKEGKSLDDFRKFDIKNEASGKTKKTQVVYALKKGTITAVTMTRRDDGSLVDPSGTVYTKVIQASNGKYYTQKAFTQAKKKNSKLTGAYTKFASGGLANFTGPAWLDGTKSKPELVLNQRDTENFIQLKDVLSSILKGNVSSDSDNSGDNIYEININVDKLENDYDVEQMAEKVKKMINSDARYRNVNAINRLR